MKTIEEEYTYLKNKFKPDFSRKADMELFETIGRITRLDREIKQKANRYLGSIKAREEVGRLRRYVLTELMKRNAARG